MTFAVTRKEMTAIQSLVFLFLFSLYFHLQNPIISVHAASNVHIVYMGERQHEDPTVVENSHHNMLATLLGSKEAARESILYSYKHGFSGFAAILTESQAEKMAEFPGVVRVMPNHIHKLHTTQSWDFLGLDFHSQKDLLTESHMGDGIIVGVIDTGVWPESRSFADEGMGPIPSHWRGRCEHGELFNSTNCNRKLIGARWYIKGIAAEFVGAMNTTGITEFLSPRDGTGHGTHTASTAAGTFVENVSYRGLATGLARGGAPRAHLAIYKACWIVGGCADADLLKAFDEAIHDGVDVLSVSIGSAVPLFPYVVHDAITVGSFHAVAKGIPVVCAAGNDGPHSATVQDTAPWILNVAATTIDRAFPAAITLGNNQTFLGQSFDAEKQSGGYRELVFSGEVSIGDMLTIADSNTCLLGILNATLVAGKVVLCFSVKNELEAAGSVYKAGGAGLILAASQDNVLRPCEFFHFHCVKVNYEIGTEILSYIRLTRSPVVKLSPAKTLTGITSPRVAYFSSRGPSSQSPAVLKPDIAAPGVDILAASPPFTGAEYIFRSGTSMACPHVAGIVTLLKSMNKDWSPAALRSALVTTASQTDVDGETIAVEDGTHKPADPFDIGGGLVNPSKAANPGLIYDMSIGDYIQFLCSMGYNNSAISSVANKTIHCRKNKISVLDLNLPSISIPNLKTTLTISRTVKNVGPTNSNYKAIVQAPHGIKIAVKPQILSFNSSTNILSFKVTFSSTRKVLGDYSFGSLTWTDGKHFVRSPIAVRAIKYESYANM